MTEPVHTYMHLYIYTCLRNNCATTFPPTRHRRPEFFNAQLFPAPIRGKRSRREFRNYPRDRAPGPVQMHVFLALHYAFVIQNVRRGRETHSRDTRARMERRHGCWMQKKKKKKKKKTILPSRGREIRLDREELFFLFPKQNNNSHGGNYSYHDYLSPIGKLLVCGKC